MNAVRVQASIGRWLRTVSWLVIIPLAWVADYVARNGLFFLGVQPVPMRLNPPLFVLSLVVALLATLLAWVRSPLGLAGRHIAPFIVALFVCSSIGLIGSLSPGAGSIVTRETLTFDPAPPPKGTVFAIPVLFANNSSLLSSLERSRLIENFEVYRGCEIGNLKVRGFASSATFMEHSHFRNLLLANDRARAVAAAIESIADVRAEVQVWQTFEAMERNKRIRDLDLSGGRVLTAEARNRRAELYWDDTTCFSPRPVNANLQPTLATDAGGAANTPLAAPTLNTPLVEQ